jgi:hypothetical protein
MKKKLIMLNVSIFIVALLVGVGFYLHHSSWLFTPAYNQRQTATTFLNDVYANKMSAAYKLTSTEFLSKNSITDFTSTESVLVGTNLKTNIKKYYLSKDLTLLTGNIINEKNSTLYSLNISFRSNKVDSVSIVRVN